MGSNKPHSSSSSSSFLASRSASTARTKRLTPALPRGSAPSNPDPDVQADFIPLPSSRVERVRASCARVLDQIEALESSFTTDSSDSNSNSNSHSESGLEPEPDKLLHPPTTTKNNNLAATITQANRATSERPYDPQVWLDLAAVQSQLLSAEGGQGKARQAIASAQLSVLECGIERVGNWHTSSKSSNNEGDVSIGLHLAHMAVSQLVHPSRKDEEDPWVHFVPLHLPGDEQKMPHLYEHCSPDAKRMLWRSYLTHLSRSRQWSLSLVMQAHVRALAWLSQAADEGQEERELTLVEIQRSAAQVLRDAGYAERSFALLQIQMALCITLSTLDTDMDIDTAWGQSKQIVGDAWDGEAENRWGEPLSPLTSPHTPV